MGEKVKTAIKKVTLNDHTFSGVTFEPTLISFFFGKNGTGKSTIAKDIGIPSTTEWVTGTSLADYDLKVYNEEFIRDNIQSYGNIPNVFTITQQNATVKAEVDKKTGDRAALMATARSLNDALTEGQGKQQKIDAAYEKAIWEKTEATRSQYKEAQAGYTRDKKKFANYLEGCTPTAVDELELASLYAIAYGPDIPPYAEYKPIDSATIPASTLLQKAVIGSSHTAFSDFVQALNASGWISQGHKTYQHIAGKKCPYCQQELPDTFEADLASCFDEQYQQSVAELEKYVQTYRDVMNGIYAQLGANMKNGFDCELISEYKTKYELLTEKVRGNVDLLKQKLADPAQVIELSDLSDLIKELNGIIERINEKIRVSNAVIKDKPTKKQECIDLVWQLLAQQCQAEIAVHKSGKTRYDADVAKLTGDRDKAKGDADDLQRDIGRLDQNTVNTTAAKDSINALLKAAGFQGFRLREKSGTQYVYELIREDDGKVAKGLSEGERNFIAFLYFYHMVIGSQSDDGKTIDEIVVIDDPVSSMDSGSMFTVASLVRDLIAICYNNYSMTEHGNRNDHIKQFFCLTHNPYFFREISYNRIADNECVNIYELKKLEHNQSIIMECTHLDDCVGGGMVNYSPVKNTYDALWSEFRTAQDSLSLMNVTRRILEYYFLQICGYSSGDLRTELLDKHQPDFETALPDGSVDKTDYNLASAMIAILNFGARGFNDGLYFDISATQPSQIRSVFKTIFEAAGQQQHYYMMMNLH